MALCAPEFAKKSHPAQEKSERDMKFLAQLKVDGTLARTCGLGGGRTEQCHRPKKEKKMSVTHLYLSNCLLPE